MKKIQMIPMNGGEFSIYLTSYEGKEITYRTSENPAVEVRTQIAILPMQYTGKDDMVVTETLSFPKFYLDKFLQS